jgi:hypothetical protein
MSLTYHSIIFFSKKSWNAKEFIHLMLNAIIAYHRLKSGMKLIQNANIMNLTQRQCVINVSLQALWLKDKNTDMLIMFNSWTFNRFKALLNIGFRKSTWPNKELDIYTDISLKIHITKEVSEQSYKQFTNRNKKELIMTFRSYSHHRTQQKPKWLRTVYH